MDAPEATPTCVYYDVEDVSDDVVRAGSTAAGDDGATSRWADDVLWTATTDVRGAPLPSPRSRAFRDELMADVSRWHDALRTHRWWRRLLDVAGIDVLEVA